MKAGYRRAGNGYEAVLRDEKGKVVWACGHVHPNRDQNENRRDGAYGMKLYRYSAWCCASIALGQHEKGQEVTGKLFSNNFEHA